MHPGAGCTSWRMWLRLTALHCINLAEAEAGQMVFHAHFHVIPRNKDDKLLALPQSSKTMLEPSEAQKMVAKIQENLDAPAPPKSPETAASGSGVIVPVLTAACVVLGAVVVKLLQN